MALSRRTAYRAACALVLWAACGAARGAESPGELLEAIRGSRLDPQRAVALHGVELGLGPARLRVESGVLLPARPVGGAVRELVFLGQARFHVEAPDEIEADQLELFTGRREVDAPVESGVLVIADPDTVQRLLDRPGPRELPDVLTERATALYSEWLGGTERRTAGVEASLFRAAVGDRAYSRFFAFYCRSHELGDLVYQLDPEDREPLTLASFVPVDLERWERWEVERHLRVQQRKGRWLGVQLRDLGAWDLWLSTAWQPESGEPLPLAAGFEPRHYELDVEIQRKQYRLGGRARIELAVNDDGRRVVTLGLFRDLVVDRVRDGAGRELYHARSGGDVLVVLPEPSRRGTELTLEVEYGGRVLAWVAPRTLDLQDTHAWYPHCGSADRATYDVRLRWPAAFDLAAPGRRVEGGRKGRYAWERRVLDQPSIAFSFALGNFEFERARVGGTELTLALGRSADVRLTPEVRERALGTVVDALRYFEEQFGPLPLGEVTVATLPRRYSQSYLGFVVLSESVLQPDRPHVDLDWVRTTTIAHEMAHQWWGNLVGWAGYRDQWLSEAVANYAALLYVSASRGDSGDFLADMSAGWRESLARKTADGYTVESLGPVILGARLNSSRAGNGYRAIVYRKGAVVLAMLARAVGQEAFLGTLRSLAAEPGSRLVTTESFLRRVEERSGLDLDGFARQFVYGTGIPEVYYDYSLDERQDEHWIVRGEIRRAGAPRFVRRLERTAAGWDVVRLAVDDAEDASRALMLPFRLRVEAEPGPDPVPASRGGGEQIREGKLFLEGRRDEFVLRSDSRPLALELDPRQEILAYVYSAERFPKRVARLRAADLDLAGDPAGAERLYRRALDLAPGDFVAGDPFPWLRDPQREGELEDARIHLSLARLLLDQGRDEAARTELDLAERALAGDPMSYRVERDVLLGRLEIRAADYDAAYRRLKKTLRTATGGRGQPDWRAIVRMLRLGSERLAMGEGFAILAVAARETGDGDVHRWSIDEARERGVDVDALEGS